MLDIFGWFLPLAFLLLAASSLLEHFKCALKKIQQGVIFLVGRFGRGQADRHPINFIQGYVVSQPKKCFCLKRRISLTSKPIWFSFTMKLLKGPGKVYSYFGEESSIKKINPNFVFTFLFLFISKVKNGDSPSPHLQILQKRSFYNRIVI